MPPLADDVTRVQRGGDQTATAGLLLEHRGDGGLRDAVLANRLGSVAFGDRHPLAWPVAPDGTTVDEVARVPSKAFYKGDR